MNRHAVIVLALLTWTATGLLAQAHTIYGKAVRTKFGHRSVACEACHLKGNDEDGKPLSKKHSNEFGKALAALLDNDSINQRIEAVKDAEEDQRKATEEQVTQEFLKALEEVEAAKAVGVEGVDGEVTWGQLLREAKLDGIKARKAKEPAPTE